MPDAHNFVVALGELISHGDRAPAVDSSATDITAFIADTFKAFERDARVLDLYAFASLHSRRDQREWIALRDVLPTGDREIALTAACACDDLEPTRVDQLGAWIVARKIGPSVVIALFADHEGARASTDDIAALAVMLRLGLGMRRRLNDSHLMSHLALAPSREVQPRGALRARMSDVALHMRSTGAKIYLLRRSATGPCIEIFARTDGDPRAQRRPYAVSRKRGLADWVFLHDDALVVDDSVRPERVHDTPERCRTTRHGTVEVFGRRGIEQDAADLTGDRERAIMLVPMRDGRRVIGVLSFWRVSDDDYDADMDVSSAEHLAARLAPICQWIVASEIRDRVARMVAEVGGLVAAVADPREVYAEVARCAGTLACGARAILLLAYEHGTMFVTAEWRADGEAAPAPFALRGDPSSWDDGVAEAAVRSRLEREHPGFRARPRPLRLGTGLDLGVGCTGGFVVVLDRAHDEHDPKLATCDDDLADSEARSFLVQIGPIVCGSYPKVFAESVARRLQASADWAGDAAEAICKATGADVVLLYHREQGQLRISGTSSGAAALRDVPIAGDSLTERCTAELRHVLVPDVEDGAHPQAARLHRDSLRRIATALDWPGVRSWYCHPVVADQRSSGVVKILTRSGGRFLDSSCIDVVTAVTAHIASEFERHFRTDMLDGLNQVATKLSGMEGSALARDMAEELDRWAHKFIQPDCHVAVIASVSSPQTSLFAARGAFDTARFEAANAGPLEALSAGPPPACWPAPPAFALPDALRAHHQVTVPIRLNGNTLLRGCILVVAPAPLGTRERLAAIEVAREVSILLDYEQRRHLRVAQGARFRHALLGPVQGVMNQADELNRLLKRGQVDPEQLRDLAARIRSEANAIGLWRDIQRLYASTEVRIVKRTQALRPIVERCVERFREPIRVERSSQLELSFRVGGSLDIPVDEPAIDLVLTNLLDNARKYCFAHTVVTVIVESLRTNVRIIIEDIGHGIPPRLEKLIYQVGERLDWEDRVRSIDGTGLGLPLSLALVAAHNGRLYHECLEGISTSDVNRCRVRFIVELPSRWRT